jgi:hypothetical protein
MPDPMATALEGARLFVLPLRVPPAAVALAADLLPAWWARPDRPFFLLPRS